MNPARRILITGGASGVGEHIAKQFLENGDRVTVIDNNAKAVKLAVESKRADYGFTCDVSNTELVEEILNKDMEENGAYEVIVNNVGISGPRENIENIDPVVWRNIFDVNVTGMFNVLRIVLPEMKRAKKGSIVNISSAAGRLGFALRSGYSASKWAVIGLTESLALELGAYGIRANAILPGLIEGERNIRRTQIRADALGQTFEEAHNIGMENVPLRRLVPPEEIAAMVAYLASNKAELITGQSIGIDGGLERFHV
ncbi:SDR family oxidoreductase [Rhodobacteraceae bacterium LMO-12]|nr:SDR family oxidoreductase [Rhodobacteraceae bacterium LMO-JJ12]